MGIVLFNEPLIQSETNGGIEMASSGNIYQITGLPNLEHSADGEYVTVTASVKDGPDINLDMPIEGLGELISKLIEVSGRASERRGAVGQFKASLDDGTEIHPFIVDRVEVAATMDRNWVVLRFFLPDQSSQDFAMAPATAIEFGTGLVHRGQQSN